MVHFTINYFNYSLERVKIHLKEVTGISIHLALIVFQVMVFSFQTEG